MRTLSRSGGSASCDSSQKFHAGQRTRVANSRGNGIPLRASLVARGIATPPKRYLLDDVTTFRVVSRRVASCRVVSMSGCCTHRGRACLSNSQTMPCSRRRTKVRLVVKRLHTVVVVVVAEGDASIRPLAEALDAFTSLRRGPGVHTRNDITATPAVLLRHYIPSYMGSIAPNPQVQQDLFVVPHFSVGSRARAFLPAPRPLRRGLCRREEWLTLLANNKYFSARIFRKRLQNGARASTTSRAHNPRIFATNLGKSHNDFASRNRQSRVNV